MPNTAGQWGAERCGKQEDRGTRLLWAGASEQFQVECRRTSQEEMHILAWEGREMAVGLHSHVEFCSSGQSVETIPGGGTCSKLSHGKKGQVRA